IVNGGGGPESPLVVFGDTSQDAVRYSGTSGVASVNGIAFAHSGRDVIDARGSLAGLTIYGGPEDDVIWGSQAGDHIAGGLGNDVIHGEGGPDYLYGNGGVNVNVTTRAITQNVGVGSGNDQIFGGPGSDVLVQQADANMVLTDTSVSGQGVDSLNGIELVSLTGGPGNNVFDVSGYTGVALIDAAGGTDRIVSTDDADFTLSDWNLRRSNGGSFSLTSIEEASLTGGPGDNTFDGSRWTGVASLAGAAGLDRVVSTNDADVTLTDASLTRSTRGTFTLSGIERATLTGGLGDNVL